MRTLTLLCPDGSIASISEVPDHATPEAAARIAWAAWDLSTARGYTMTFAGGGSWGRGTVTPGQTNHAMEGCAAVCACLSGSTCDVSHDPAKCGCRQCVAGEALDAIRMHADSDAVRRAAHETHAGLWPSMHGRDLWPLGPLGHHRMDTVAIRESDDTESVCTLREWVAANEAWPLDASDIAAVAALQPGHTRTVNLGAGGYVEVRKVWCAHA